MGLDKWVIGAGGETKLPITCKAYNYGLFEQLYKPTNVASETALVQEI